MFEPNASVRFIPARRESVVAVIESNNQPQVSIPGKPPQKVAGHMVALRNANNTFSVYIALYLSGTNENFVYFNEKREVTLENYRPVEQEALQFLESMGFMVNNLNYAKLKPDQQDSILKRLPIFSDPAQSPSRAGDGDKGATGGADKSVRLARLLASF